MDGIIVINKEKNYTSNDVVRKVKKIFHEKVGHTGTLDPNATGVLPILIGNGTKISSLLINHDKIYEATIKLGEKRDTADVEGKVIEIKDVNKKEINEENITKIFNSFIGKQLQTPPIYSAIKINGKKLYEYARNNQEVEIKPREIEIYDINLTNIDIDNNEIRFIVSCSKGTYIRTLCEDIAEKLNTVGYMLELNRIKVGEFDIKDSIKIDELEKQVLNNNFKSIISIEDFFKEKDKIVINNKAINKYLNGVSLKVKVQKNNDIYRIYHENKFIGLGNVVDNSLKRYLVL